MRTMFKAEVNVYGTIDDRWADFKQKGNYVDTIEEAKELVKDTPHTFPYTGDYRVVAVTMDEATFTVTEKIVINFNYYNEIGKWEEAKREIALCNEYIAEIEASKKRVRTENGMNKKNAEIERYKKRIEAMEEKMKTW